MSATWKALRMVESIGCQFRGAVGQTPAQRPILALDEVAGAAGCLDLLARIGAEGVGVNRERLRQLASGEDLDRYVIAGTEALGLEHLVGDLGARTVAGVQVGDVYR